jgi:hypothetical protein
MKKLEKPGLPVGMTWLEPWNTFSSSDSDRQAAFENELKAELGPQHPIFEQAHSAKAIAFRADCDDVLFWLPYFSKPFAIVNLIWHGKAEENPSFPTTTLIGSIKEFIAEYMIPENEMWKAGNWSSI